METAVIERKPKQKRSKITFQDMEAICRLIVTRRLNESEAASKLGIHPRQWFLFKNRKANLPKYDTLITQIRAASIDACIQSIDEAGDGIGMKQRDWRAKAWIAERVLAPERFAERKNETLANSTSVTVNMLGGDENVRRLVEQYARAADLKIAQAQQGQIADKPVEKLNDASCETQ